MTEPANTSDEDLSKIKEILYGEQAREFSRRLAEIESSTAAHINKLEETIAALSATVTSIQREKLDKSALVSFTASLSESINE